MKTNQLIIIGALLAVSGLSGCAITPATVNLDYKPMATAEKVQGANNITVSVHAKDLRENKKVSNKINTWGMNMATVSASKPVADTISNAIESGLKAKGFNIGDNAQIHVDADISKFYGNEMQGWHINTEGMLDMTVKVESIDNALIYSKNISEKALGEKVNFTSPENSQLALNRVIDKAMEDLFNDKDFIAALMTGAKQK